MFRLRLRRPLQEVLLDERPALEEQRQAVIAYFKAVTDDVKHNDDQVPVWFKIIKEASKEHL